MGRGEGREEQVVGSTEQERTEEVWVREPWTVFTPLLAPLAALLSLWGLCEAFGDCAGSQGFPGFVGSPRAVPERRQRRSRKLWMMSTSLPIPHAADYLGPSSGCLYSLLSAVSAAPALIPLHPSLPSQLHSPLGPRLLSLLTPSIEVITNNPLCSIGMALTDALDDLISEGRIAPQLAMKILNNFDKHVTEVLSEKVKANLTFKVRLSQVWYWGVVGLGGNCEGVMRALKG